MRTTPEANKVLIRKWLDAWMNTDLAILDKLFTKDYSVNGALIGIDGVKQTVEFFHAVLADVSAELNEMIAEGDKVVVRWTIRGRHIGDFMGVPPTGQLIELQGINIYHLIDGKIDSNQEQTNVSEVIQRLKAGN